MALLTDGIRLGILLVAEAIEHIAQLVISQSVLGASILQQSDKWLIAVGELYPKVGDAMT